MQDGMEKPVRFCQYSENLPCFPPPISIEMNSIFNTPSRTSYTREQSAIRHPPSPPPLPKNRLIFPIPVPSANPNIKSTLQPNYLPTQNSPPKQPPLQIPSHPFHPFHPSHPFRPFHIKHHRHGKLYTSLEYHHHPSSITDHTVP